MLIRKIGGSGANSSVDPNAADVGLFIGWSDGSSAPLDLGPESISLTVNNSPTQFDGAFVPNLVDFDGTNQNITWSYDAALNTAQDYTLELIIQPDANGGYPFQMFGTNGGVFCRYSGGTLQFRVSSFATAVDVFTPALDTGSLYSFALTHDHSTGVNNLYQGTALIDTATETGDNWQSGGSAYFGGTTSNYFNGKAAVRFTGGVIRSDFVQILKDPRITQ
jgi:hypothetical protein